jgi:hypothetical protein
MQAGPSSRARCARAAAPVDPRGRDGRAEHRRSRQAELDDELDVFLWRTKRLLGISYESEEATRLASSPVDIHELEHLIGNGCPLETAVRIAA